MDITFDSNTTKDLDQALEREWLETNGLGGYASSTLAGAHTRGYHGLLVAATKPPTERQVLLSRLDETLVVSGERFELATRIYPGAVHPNGYHYLESYQQKPFPAFEYKTGKVSLRKSIAALHGENTVIVSYEVLSAPRSFVMELRPFIAARDYHFRSRASQAIEREPRFDRGVLICKPYPQTPEFFVSVPGSTFERAPDWYYQFEYREEKRRGLDALEDLFTPGFFRVTLQPGARLQIMISTKLPTNRDATALLALEQTRRKNLLTRATLVDDLTMSLLQAADQFIVQRERDLKTVVAGYHWFTDWGRDTMIALPGLCLATGAHEDAKKILKAFARYQNQGLLPNRFPEGGRDPEYNSIDAALWFAVASYKTYQYTQDLKLIRETVFPVLKEMIDWFRKGTWYYTKVDGDGLLSAGSDRTNLTWMDARVDDQPVTPRHGKAVELNALWYNMLCIAGEFAAALGSAAEAADYQALAANVRTNFRAAFWNEAQGCLYDVIRPSDKDDAIRPNQILALSLPFALLEESQARRVLQIVEERLVTPVGLRSLDPRHPGYHGRYEGDGRQRDAVYHQGTVWSWLLGPYVTAIYRFHERAVAEQKAGQILAAIKTHLLQAGLGSISEIFDGDVPHTPRGCIAQAWSVGEVLRAYVEDVCGLQPGQAQASRSGEGAAAKSRKTVAVRPAAEEMVPKR